MRCKLLLGLLCAMPAVFAYQCPNNTNRVENGDSLGTVLLKCGQPKQIIKPGDKKTPQGKKPQTVWSYYVPALGVNPARRTMIYLGKDGVTKITVNGQELKQIDCPGGTLKVGDTMYAAQQACGTPQMQYNEGGQNVFKVPGAGTPSKPGGGASGSDHSEASDSDLTRVIYQPHSYLPRIVFEFKDGKLINKTAMRAK